LKINGFGGRSNNIFTPLCSQSIDNKAFHFFTGPCNAHEPLGYQEKRFDLCGMFFKTASRINPQTGNLSIYYRLVENSRNALGGIFQRNIMTVGYMDDVSTEELHRIADVLNDRISGQGTLIEESQKVKGYVDHLYTRLVKEKRIDRVLDSRKKL